MVELGVGDTDCELEFTSLSVEFGRLLGGVCGVTGSTTGELGTYDSDKWLSGSTMGMASATFSGQLAVFN